MLDAKAVPAAAAGVKDAAGTTPAVDTAALKAGTGAAPAALGPGASRLPSGVEYEVLKAGEGPSPAIGSKVLVHFSATIDGTKKVLDTWPANVPKEYRLDSKSLIRGWVDALVTMKKGERRKLKVPSQLAYGAMGYPPVIPPNKDVVFELELVNFTPAAAQ
jgi:FKBP-type peptidyl-prolyl cis-trans isomerase